jgi:hypothetical protein
LKVQIVPSVLSINWLDIRVFGAKYKQKFNDPNDSAISAAAESRADRLTYLLLQRNRNKKTWSVQRYMKHIFP